MSAAADTPTSTSTPSPTPQASADTGASTPSSSQGPYSEADLANLTWDDLRGTPKEERANEREHAAVQAWIQGRESGEEKDGGKTEARAEKADPKEAQPKQPAKDGGAERSEAAEAAAPAKAYRVKLRGEERELTREQLAAVVQLPAQVLDTLPDQDAAALYQRLWQGDDEARTRTKLEQEVQQLFSKVRGDPLTVLEELVKRAEVSTPFKELALQYVARDLELQALPPVERELRELKEKIARQEQERETILAEHHRQVEAKRRADFAAELSGVMNSVIAESKLPNGFAFARIEQLLQRERAERGANYEPMRSKADMEQRVRSHVGRVQAELREAVRGLYAASDASSLEAFMAEHPELYHALGEHRVAQFRKNSNAQVQARTANAEQSAAANAKTDTSWDALDKEIREVLAKA